MDQLPDEILLKILKHSYKHPSEILRSLSLVCKRWKKLSEDQHCWSEAELTLSCSHPRDTFLSNAITLTKSPHLLALTLVCNNDGNNKCSLIQCLQLCVEKHMKIEKLSVEFNEQGFLSHLLQFIEHIATSSLKMLKLDIIAREWTSFPQRFPKMDTIGSLFDMFMRIKTLKSLEISLTGYLFFQCVEQSRFVPPLENVTLHVSDILLSSSLEIFGKNVLSLTSQTVKHIDLNVKFPGSWLLPDIYLPNVETLILGLIENPLLIKRELLPRLAHISFQWLMKRTDNISEKVINMLHWFKNVFVSCRVVVFGSPIQVFNEQQVRNIIFSVHAPETCDLHFQVDD